MTIKNKLTIWQIFFITFSLSWLFAPSFNHLLSYRLSLISQYEAGMQPYAWLFRTADIIGGLLLVIIAYYFYKYKTDKISTLLILIVGLGMLIDPIFTTNCHLSGNACIERTNLSFYIHAIETVITTIAACILIAYDAYKRHRLVSLFMLGFEVIYFVIYLTNIAGYLDLKTLSQYLYQSSLILWLAWYCREVLIKDSLDIQKTRINIIRTIAATWTFINGIFAILISLAHIRIIGNIHGIYFAGNYAWLSQHGAIVGIVMIYLSRHLYRGELRARQIILALLGIEAIKYSVVTPNPYLLALYGISFILLFVSVDDFKRGTIPLTWQVRFKDLAFLIAGLVVSIGLGTALLKSDEKAFVVARHSLHYFPEYLWHSDRIKSSHRLSALLSNTITAFIGAALAAILWILFKPTKVKEVIEDKNAIKSLLEKYSNSSEDFFKLWPEDKSYFWDADKQAFIAYKIQGAIAFAVADPIGPKAKQAKLIKDFTGWCRTKRLNACFLPVSESSLKLYSELKNIQIGSSALIKTEEFCGQTVKDKWWRWKINKAVKAGLSYEVSLPPHNPVFVQALRSVSDAWLTTGGHEERGFVLGYFDEEYLSNCPIHFLKDTDGKVVAFANQMPTFNNSTTETIDLLRYLPEAADPMAYLLSSVITNSLGVKTYLDLTQTLLTFTNLKQLLQVLELRLMFLHR